MPTLLQISQLGHPILREKAEDVKDPAIQTLINNMIATCQDVGGVGIAAPQIYQRLRFFIIASKIIVRPQCPSDIELIPVINPTIISTSDEMEEGWEGCLSIPGIRGFVPRHKSIEVSFMNRDGDQENRVFDGFIARVLQHEYDHINGVLFLDRTKYLATDREYQRIIRETSKK